MEQEKTGEKVNKVVIDVADCDNVKEYSGHFKVPLLEELETALDSFKGEQSFENQQEIKLQMCKWILTSTHESFKDEMWNTPKDAAKEIVYNLQFDKDLTSALDRGDITQEEVDGRKKQMVEDLTKVIEYAEGVVAEAEAKEKK